MAALVSADDPRGLPLRPSIDSVPPIDQVSGWPSRGSLGPMSVKPKPEHSNVDEFSQDGVDEMIKCAWDTKRRFETLREKPAEPEQTLKNNIRLRISNGATQELLEAKIDDIPSPLVKSLYGANNFPTTRVAKREEEFNVKEEPEELKMVIISEVLDPEGTKQTTTGSDSDICVTQGPQHPSGSQIPYFKLPESHTVQTKQTLCSQVQLGGNVDRIDAISSKDLARPLSAGMGSAPPLKSTFHSYFDCYGFDENSRDHLRPQTGTRLPLNRDPHNNGNFPSHPAVPQSSRLLKSLFGLARCRASQMEASDYSFNPTDTSNMHVPHYSQSHNLRVPGTGGLHSDALESTEARLHVALQQSYNQGYEAGRAQGHQEALGYLAVTSGMSRSHIPTSVHSAPTAPIPWHMSYSQQDISYQARYYPSTPNIQTTGHPESPPLGNARIDQPHRVLSTVAIPVSPGLSFGAGEAHMNLDEYGQSLPSYINPGQPFGVPFPNHALGTGENNSENDLQVQLSQGSESGPEISSPADAGKRPNSSAKACKECEQV
ncbi:hypothetical protein RSOLAG22IIIB_05178 [Rhizoctonia solani]|uniref:Uncharacterized protein n=1 Tax=Rhizoctonia solani TaxID=456999 RepID=A0A0K6G4J5_9AGAM|nr:hypothetical protein RSOLAG22IIIB_05178 [Rhizoctonia solani]